jgi:hypothetical protein
LAHETSNDFLNELKVCKFDNQLNLINSKSYFFNDSNYYYTFSLIKDDENNFLLLADRQGIYAGNYGFFMKFDKFCDTINSNFNVSFTLRPICIEQVDKYLCTKNNNYLLYYDKNLIQVGSISVMDTFFSSYTSVEILGEDSLVMSGYKMEVTPSDNKRNAIFKTIDFLGNTIDFYQINTPDTVNNPAYNKAVAVQGNNLYFAWYKQEQIHQGTGPSKIGVGKFNKSLQPQWIKYFGKFNTLYVVNKVIASSDGGCLIVGIYKKTSYPNDDWRYFILKVNSQGLATFMKHTDIKIITDVNIYPNPATDNITIQLINPKQSIKSISIFDIRGKEVINKQLNSNQLQLDVSSLSSGVYLIKGQTNSGLSFSRKFVKE